MKDRCIDDVAIRYSFVSRNYRKALSSCTTIFCFSKFDIAHDLVQALCNDTAQKWVRMLRFSSHLSVQTYDSSSANISWRGFFRRDNKLFFSRGVASRGNDKRRLRDNRCDELHCHVTAAQLQLLSSHLFPQYFFCWVRYVPNEIRKKLSWKRQP